MTVTTESKLEDEDKDKHFHLKFDESKDVFKARLTIITDEETETLKTSGIFTVTVSNGLAAEANVISIDVFFDFKLNFCQVRLQNQ